MPRKGETVSDLLHISHADLSVLCESYGFLQSQCSYCNPTENGSRTGKSTGHLLKQ